MKKFLALIISFAYIFASGAAFAMSELYYLTNVKRDTLSPQVEALLLDKNYTIKKKNPFWAVSTTDPENYAVVILEPTGQNLFYYFEANKKGSKFQKAFLKSLKEQGIVYQEYYGDMYLNHFAQMAQKAMTGEARTYSFETPAIQTTPQQAQVTKTQVPDNALKGFVASVGGGSTLDVYLQNAINTATANVGDSVVGVLKSNWTVDGAHVIAPQGSVLYGNLTKAVSARYGSRNGGVSIDFNKLVTPDGKSYDLVTQPIDFDVTNDGKFKSAATSVATSAALGALAGLAFALLGGDHYGTGAAIGAGVAGGMALVSNVAAKGVDAEIPSYTELEVKVEQNVNVIFNY